MLEETEITQPEKLSKQLIENQTGSKPCPRTRTESVDSGVSTELANIQIDELVNEESKNDEVTRDVELCLSLMKKLKNYFTDEHFLKDSTTLNQIFKNLSGQASNEVTKPTIAEKTTKKKKCKKESNKENQEKADKRCPNTDGQANKPNSSPKNLQDIKMLLSDSKSISIPSKLGKKLILITQFDSSDSAEECLLGDQLKDAAKDSLLLSNQQAAKLLAKIKLRNEIDRTKFSILVELNRNQQVDSVIDQLNKQQNGLNVIKLIKPEIGPKNTDEQKSDKKLERKTELCNKQPKKIEETTKRKSLKEDQTECLRKQRSFTFSNGPKVGKWKNEFTKRNSLGDALSATSGTQNDRINIKISNRINSNNNLLRLPIPPSACSNGFSTEARLRTLIS